MKKDFRFWNIILFDISPSTANLLFESGETIDSFLICDSEFLKKFKKSKPNLYSEISYIITKKYNYINDGNSIYVLLGYGLSLSLAKTLRQKYLISKIDDLTKKINGVELPVWIGQKNSIKVKQILLALNNTNSNCYNHDVEEVLNTSANIDENSIVLNTIESNFPITSFKLINIIRNKHNLDEDKIKDSLQYLLLNKKIQFSTDGYIPKLNNLDQFILNIEDKRKQQILVDRLNGETLESIAVKNNLTRERVRQIIDKILEKRQPIFEDKYKAYFKDYNLTENQFTKLFDVNPQVYYLFSIEEKKGNKSIFELAKELGVESKLINEINSSELDNNEFIYDGEVLKINVSSIIEYLIRKYRNRKLKNTEFYKIYCVFVQSNLRDYSEKLITNERNFTAICERSQKILNCNSSRIKYYDTDEYDLKPLRTIFEKIQDNSFISTELIFTNNRKIMKAININDQYELHSLLRSMYSEKDEKYVFHRMPMIQIGTLSKKDFVIRELSLRSPITIKDFAYFFKRIYGYDINSFKSYLSTELAEYIYFDTLNIEFKQFTEYEINTLKEMIKTDFIMVQDLAKYIENMGLDSKKYINNLNIKRLGLLSYSTYCISERNISTEKFFNDYLLKFSKFDINKDILNDYKKIPAFMSALSKLLKDLVFVQIDEYYYVRIEIISQSSINKDYLIGVIALFEKIASEKPFVTIEMIDKNTLKNIEDNEISIEMIELLLKNASNLFFKKVGDVYLFSKLKPKDIPKEFIGLFINGKNNYKLFDLRKHIYKEFGISLEEDKIREMIMETSLFYSSDLDAVFQNKDNYYKEIYANEEFTFE